MQTNDIRYNILFLTKWYPNKFDPQLGVFVRKHAKAISDQQMMPLTFRKLFANLAVRNDFPIHRHPLFGSFTTNLSLRTATKETVPFKIR